MGYHYSRPRRVKYGNKSTIVNGIRFDSKAESNRYSELVILEKAGEIYNLKLQVIFSFPVLYKSGNAIKYRADFTYNTKDGEYVVEDVKGYETQSFRIKEALMKHFHGITIKIM